MNVALRSYRPADCSQTRHVFETAIRVTASAFYTTEQIDAWCPRVFDQATWADARARAWTIVAEAQGKVVGFSDLTDDGVLDMLFVDPMFAGQGVARQLIQTVLAEARRRGYEKVTTRASRAARPVFEQLGFVVTQDNPHNTIRGVAVPNHDMFVPLV